MLEKINERVSVVTVYSVPHRRRVRERLEEGKGQQTGEQDPQAIHTITGFGLGPVW